MEQAKASRDEDISRERAKMQERGTFIVSRPGPAPVVFAGSSNSAFHGVPLEADFNSGQVKNNKPVPDLTKVSEWVKSTIHPLVFEGRIYVYDAQKKKYVPENHHIESLAVKAFNQNGYEIPDDRIIKTLLRMSAGLNFLEYPFNSSPNLLNCKNGILHMDTLVLEPHGSDSWQHGHDYTIETNFKPGNTPDFDRFSNEWGCRDVLIDIGGLGICQKLLRQTWKTAYVLEGSPSGGKSTALELIRLTFNSCCSAVDLTRLCDDRFALSEVDTCLLNLADEIPSLVKDASHFKNVTGSVFHSCQAKFKPSKNSILTALHVFATNDLPEVTRPDSGWWGRWNITELKNSFPVNPLIKEQIHAPAVREQYFYLSVLRAQEIIKSGYQNPQTADEVEILWLSRTSGALRYISDRTDGGLWTDTHSLKEIYEDYWKWCKLEGKPPVSDRKLAALLSRNYGKYLKDNTAWFRGVVLRKW
jgi:phage/plasmid-associated DNA primase